MQTRSLHLQGHWDLLSFRARRKTRETNCEIAVWSQIVLLVILEDLHKSGMKPLQQVQIFILSKLNRLSSETSLWSWWAFKQQPVVIFRRQLCGFVFLMFAADEHATSFATARPFRTPNSLDGLSSPGPAGADWLQACLKELRCSYESIRTSREWKSPETFPKTSDKT